jgi:hypothetical protein
MGGGNWNTPKKSSHQIRFHIKINGHSVNGQKNKKKLIRVQSSYKGSHDETIIQNYSYLIDS